MRARRDVEIAEHVEARHAIDHGGSERAAEEQRWIAVVPDDAQGVCIDRHRRIGHADTDGRAAETAIEQVEAGDHLRGVAAAHEVRGVLRARCGRRPGDQHFIAARVEVAERPFGSSAVVDPVAEGVVAFECRGNRIEIAAPARRRERRHRRYRADDTGVAVVDDALPGQILDVRDGVAVEPQHLKIGKSRERLRVDDGLVAQAQHPQVGLHLERSGIDNGRGQRIGQQHRGRDDLLRSVHRVVAQLDAGAAERLEVVEPQVVPSLREDNAAGCLAHGMEAVVVDHQATVDEQLAAVIGLGEEAHATGRADPDLAAPARKEQVAVHVGGEAALGRRVVHGRLDAGIHRVIVAERADGAELAGDLVVDLVDRGDRSIGEEALRLVPVARRQAAGAIAVEREKLQTALHARGLLPLQARELRQVADGVAVEGQALQLIHQLDGAQLVWHARVEGLDERIEIERQVMQVEQTRLEVDRVTIDTDDVIGRRAGAQGPELPLLQPQQFVGGQVVVGEVQALEIDGEVEPAQVLHVARRGIEQLQLGQATREDALLPGNPGGERSIGAVRAAIDVDERASRVVERDRQAERLGDGNAQAVVLDRDQRIGERPDRQRRQFAAVGIDAGFAPEVEIADFETFADEAVLAAVAGEPVDVGIADDEIVAVAAGDAVAIGGRVRVAELGRRHLDLERGILRDRAVGTVDPQVEAAGLHIAQVDDGGAARNQLAFLGVQVGQHALVARDQLEPGLAGRTAACHGEPDLVMRRGVLHPYRQPGLATRESRAHRRGEIDLGRGAGNLAGRAESGRSLVIEHRLLVVAFTLQDADLHVDRRRHDLVEHPGPALGAIGHPEFVAGPEKQAPALRVQLIRTIACCGDEARGTRGSVGDEQLLVAHEEQARARIGVDGGELARIGTGNTGGRVRDPDRARAGAIGSPQFSPGRRVVGHEEGEVACAREIRRERAVHHARPEERHGRQFERRPEEPPTGAPDPHDPAGSVRRVHVEQQAGGASVGCRGVETVDLGPGQERGGGVRAVEGIQRPEHHLPVRQHGQAGGAGERPRKIGEPGEDAAVIAEHVAVESGCPGSGREQEPVRPRGGEIADEPEQAGPDLGDGAVGTAHLEQGAIGVLVRGRAAEVDAAADGGEIEQVHQCGRTANLRGTGTVVAEQGIDPGIVGHEVQRVPVARRDLGGGKADGSPAVETDPGDARRAAGEHQGIGNTGRHGNVAGPESRAGQGGGNGVGEVLTQVRDRRVGMRGDVVERQGNGGGTPVGGDDAQMQRNADGGSPVGRRHGSGSQRHAPDSRLGSVEAERGRTVDRDPVEGGVGGTQHQMSGVQSGAGGEDDGAAAQAQRRQA